MPLERDDLDDTEWQVVADSPGIETDSQDLFD
jgi:hypothetical protein